MSLTRKEIERRYREKHREEIRARARARSKEQRHREYLRYQDSYVTQTRRWRAANRIRYNSSMAAWRKRNAEVVREYERRSRRRKAKWERQAAAGLRAAYIRKAIRSNIGEYPNVVPSGVLEAKRAQLTIHRQLRKLKEAINGKKQQRRDRKNG